MYIQNSINPAEPAFLRRDSSQFNQNRETFHEIFQRTLNNKSSSRPPKFELIGILVPCSKVVHGYCSGRRAGRGKNVVRAVRVVCPGHCFI